ncbi:MAG TPA: hypothetical protein VJ727_10440 [Rhodanobacteraceae bacterium]|nr:hypothetical protein [Rhodanobacteraceae bacterium]
MKQKEQMRVLGKLVAVSGVPMLAAIGIGAHAVAGTPAKLPAHFSGVLSDYTPMIINGAPVKGAPYEMHGNWSLDLNGTRTQAAFSAEIAMETSEVVNPDPNFDPTQLNPHTHHISMTGGVVHDGPTDWQTMCPAVSSVTGGFVVTGSAYITGNGANAPFGNPSPVTICILGGSDTLQPNTAYVAFANVTLTIGSPASGHFGPQPIHGVVTGCTGSFGTPRHDCEVAVVQ